MTKKVKEYLDKIRDQKLEQLMGIALDFQYWQNIIGQPDEEANLRKELAKENDKRIFKKNGEVFKDERDLAKVNVLNNRINEIEKAKQQITQLTQMDAGIRQYVKHITEPDKITQDKLEEVAKM